MFSQTVAVVAVYCCCSSMMLIVNKLAVHHIGAPAFVTWLQFAATAGTVKLASLLGLIDVDPFEWSKVKYFAIYVLAFSGGTWSNMKVLMEANVETVIVFRACAPLAVSGFDYIFHRRSLPSIRSSIAMLIIVGGAAGYVTSDKSFQVNGLGAYTWVFVWFFLLIFQLTYGKYLVSGLGIKSAWTAVLYTNTLSLLPTACIGLVGPEAAKLRALRWTARGVFWLAASCGLGLGISWAGFKCQSLVAATTYTIIGVMNKMFTVLVNVVIWDNHASPLGIVSLAACLVGGSLYQQAPLRKDPSVETKTLLSPLPEDSEPACAMVNCNSRLSFTSGATTTARCGGNTPRTEEGSVV